MDLGPGPQDDEHHGGPEQEQHRGVVQPQLGPSERARSPVTSQPDMKAAPSQLTRPGDRTGDSGTKMKVAMVAGKVIIRGNQKSQW